MAATRADWNTTPFPPDATIEEALRAGLTRAIADGRDVTYRFLALEDDVDAITDLLHRAYAPLAQASLQYVASHQASDITRRRLARGDTIVAISSGRLIGLVTLAMAAATSGSPFYDRSDVASFGQFAVEPSHQGFGIGSALLEFVEALAVARDVGTLALDTAEQADVLVRFYTNRGYRFVEFVRWPDVNYRSVILAKALRPHGLPLAVATSSDADYTEFSLRQTGLDDRFRMIVTGDQVARGKPAPDIYAEAARRLGIEASKCMALEDSEAGILSASRAGMLAVLIPQQPPSVAAARAAFQVLPSLHEARLLVETMS